MRRLHARYLGLPPNSQAALLILANAILMAFLVLVVRRVGETVPTMMIVFFRNFFGLLIVLPVALVYLNTMRTKALDLHLWRGGLTVASMAAYYWSYSHLMLAETTALVFTMPLFLIVVSAVALGEKVRWRRTTATVIGFIGVLVIVRPGADFEWGLLAPLSVGLIDAVVGLLVRQAALRDRLLTVMVYMSFCTLAFAALPAAIEWQTPTLHEAGLLFVIAAISTLSQIFTVTAWRVGEATAVAPVNYVQILVIAISGYLAYGEVPSIWTALGATIIAASTFYIVRRESQLRARAVQATSSSSTNK